MYFEILTFHSGCNIKQLYWLKLILNSKLKIGQKICFNFEYDFDFFTPWLTPQQDKSARGFQEELVQTYFYIMNPNVRL